MQKISASRRKFVGGLGLLGLFSVIAGLLGISVPAKKNIISCMPETKKKMVKMLTQDGKLVEVDESLLPPKGKKINDKELQNWITSHK